MLSGFDILLLAVSFSVMVFGFARLHRKWGQGREGVTVDGGKNGGIRQLLVYLLTHRKILENRTKGILHIFVFWGVLLPLLIIILAQFKVTFPVHIARGLSLLLDLIGFCAMSSLGILIFMRFRKENTGADKKSSVHLWLLLAIMLTGFITGGTRLAIIPADGLWSPVGFLFSVFLPASPSLLKIFIKIHFFLVLVFIAYLPFSNMRHVLAASLNIYYQNDEQKEIIKVLSLNGAYFGAGRTQDFYRQQLLAVDACVACERCEQNCPAAISEKDLSPHKTVVRKIQDQMERDYRTSGNGLDGKKETKIKGTDKWSCTTCLSCTQVCPVLVGPLEKIIDLRRYAVLSESIFPQEYKQLFKNLEIFGDNMGKGPLMREEWMSPYNICRLYENNEDVEYLFWPGCQGGLDERNKNTTIAAVEILNKAGIRFAVLGKEELCCGDPVLRMGNEYLYQKLAKRNITLFEKYGVKKIITYCPHCYNVFKKEYPHLGADFEVVYFVELIEALLMQEKLKIESKIDDLYTYQDPCYLGRYNSIYDAPRNIFKTVLDLDIIEMPRFAEKSFCCGAGGGNVWRGKATGKRMEELRIEEAIDTKVSGIITSCPFCDIMLDSAVKQKGMEYSFAVTNIIELVNKSL